MLSQNLEQTLHRALGHASDRDHEFATLEHLLLALTDDQDAVSVLRACNVDVDKLAHDLRDYIDTELTGLVTDREEDVKPTAGFQRVLQRAAIHVQSSGREEVTGANVLVAMFAERESHAVYFLQEQDMTRFDAVNYISHGIAKVPGHEGSFTPSGADEEAQGETVVKQGKEALAAYCVDLNKKAADGKIDPLIGRERAKIERTIQVLCRRQKEQSALRGRPRRRQDRHRRRAGAADRQWRRAGGGWRTPRSSRSTWARCSPARAIAAISRSGSRQVINEIEAQEGAGACSSTKSTR